MINLKLSIKEMIKANIHFGHQTKFWNPKMKKYIYTKFNKIHIINLEKTSYLFKIALYELYLMFKNKQKILFIGTKKNSYKQIKNTAIYCKQFYINKRWLGGMLTNWNTVKKSIKYLKNLESELKSGLWKKLTKKEYLYKQKLLKKLNDNLGGIKNINTLPDAIFVIDAKHENLAIQEAKKLKIKIFSIVDTNTNPDGINYIIPGNDDSIKSINWYLNQINKIYISTKNN